MTFFVRLAAVFLSLVLLISAESSWAGDLDPIAEAYVRLALAAGQHDPDFVDAYYGPDAWKDEAASRQQSLDSIHSDASALLRRLEELPAQGSAREIFRHSALMQNLSALKTRVEILRGESMSFDEESLALYGTTSPKFAEEHFASLLKELETILPGEGSLVDRREAFRQQFVVPPKKLDELLRIAISECRARTVQFVDLPEAETLEIEYVTGKPWGGYNWYQGDGKSLIQINTDLPIFIDSILGYACHEGYPGHHLFNLLTEQEQYRELGWVEAALYPLFGPQSLIAEGTAVYGVDLAFPGDERVRFETERLFPVAGLDAGQVELYVKIEDLVRQLRFARIEAARRYLDGQMSAEEYIRWIRSYQLQSEKSAQRSLHFTETYRSYVINYSVGEQLVARFVETAGSSREARWAQFLRLLRAPLLPEQLSKLDSRPDFDVILRGGTVFDGSGGEPFAADVALDGERIAAIGDLGDRSARLELDVRGLAVSPGFINMLSWSNESLLLDGQSQSEVRQGVTLQVLGEGWSMGPMNAAVRADLLSQRPPEIDYPIVWTTLGGYLDHLVKNGVAQNVASFVGNATLRIHVMDGEDRLPTEDELSSMKSLVRQAMKEGAMGLSSALEYAPSSHAQTQELIALAKVAAEFGGMYISHLRSEGRNLDQAVAEIISIARESGARAEIYHFKAADRVNWDKLEGTITQIERAREEGIPITADMYTYTAGATGLEFAFPLWVQEGGFDEWKKRLETPEIRRRVLAEMSQPSDEWENALFTTGADKMMLVGFRNPELRSLTGRTLAQVAEQRGISPAEAAIQLVVEDGSRVGTVYFFMSEENVRRKITLPWMSFGSDEASQAPEGYFLESMPHPRAYGNFARLLGHYVREEKLLSLAEAIRRLTSLPAGTLKVQNRGALKPGYYADLAVFDAGEIRDNATFEKPHQFATGMIHVFVNGRAVLQNGEITGDLPGQVVKGPGWQPAPPPK